MFCGALVNDLAKRLWTRERHYLVYFHYDQKVVVFQVDLVPRTDDRGYLLDDGVTLQNVVVADCRTDSKLQCTVSSPTVGDATVYSALSACALALGENVV